MGAWLQSEWQKLGGGALVMLPLMLVFAVVTMQGRCQRARRQLMMNYGEAAAGLRTIDFPLRAEAASMEFLTSLKRDQQWTGWKR